MTTFSHLGASKKSCPKAPKKVEAALTFTQSFRKSNEITVIVVWLRMVIFNISEWSDFEMKNCIRIIAPCTLAKLSEKIPLKILIPIGLKCFSFRHNDLRHKRLKLIWKLNIFSVVKWSHLATIYLSIAQTICRRFIRAYLLFFLFLW